MYHSVVFNSKDFLDELKGTKTEGERENGQQVNGV